MKRLIYIIIIFFAFGENSMFGQSKAELEEQRRKTLEEIAYVDNMLKSTARERLETVGALKILGNKLNLRESIIKGMADEISLLNERIELNNLAVDMMESDLEKLKNDYAQSILNSYKAKKVNPDMVYILSARDFNQGYKRLKYLQQVALFRRSEAELINELKIQVEGRKRQLLEDLGNMTELQRKELQQKALLQQEQGRRQRIVRTLGTKEKQLQKDLQEKKVIARRLEAEIAKVIEAERKRNVLSDLTPEQQLIGENFADNRGKLPWPVERGIITSKFGSHPHPVLKYVTEENIGVEITSNGKTRARAIFFGEVTAVFPTSGANMTVIIRHGKYLSVYNNLINVRVKKGDMVDTKQDIGEVFSDTATNNNSTIRFMIFEQKYLDPEIWLTKS